MNLVVIGAALLLCVPARADQADRQRKIELRKQQPPPELVKGQPRREASGAYFGASFTPQTDRGAIPLAKMQTWTFAVKTLKGEPVAKADVSLRGIMPQHGHGFASTPSVRETMPGIYEASGLKFHMPGWWVLHLDVRAGAEAETLNFQLLL